ncbi:RNA polymerase sigma factor [Silicimonas algicola]|uniref:RNA polymerase ECF family sigma subunit n=1 Tax=Silicimonas algicola TaxID=1826607 RepID=A0A316G267_9RHOB|nr:RNA polymerase sigma factor [Silicimonas algicola]AZQ69155.1 RNA polymerase sigma factor [Silicimonas algicola]PWK55034.1 RNA polymerase ECF family sigma subunit [Silicimonas algicola]
MDGQNSRPDAPADEAPDAALLVAFANGDAAAGRDLVARLAPRLFGYSVRVLGDRAEAEDVVQETMMKLWKVAPDWRQGEAQVSTWAYRVAVNLCTDRLRRRKVRGQVPLETVPEPEADIASAVDRMTETARADALQAALDELPDRQRQAVVLRHLEGLSNPEIAAIMDIGVEAVESLTARGKRALAAILAGRREELGYDNG